MPLSGGVAGDHDDGMHQGSAKRDVVDGVAGLDAVGRVLAPGNGIEFVRDGANLIKLRDQTSDETFIHAERLGVYDWVLYTRYGAAMPQILNSDMKDVVSGIAALDAGGAVLAQGSELKLTRDGSENIELIERTSAEIVARWTRTGVNDYQAYIHCGGLVCQFQHSGMKDVASGIAGLNADIEVPLALMPREYDLSMSDADINVTGDQLVSVFPFRMTPSADRLFNLPTAAAVYNEIPGARNRTTFMFSVTSLAAFNVTVTTNTGFTLFGSMVVNNGSGLFAVIISDLNNAFLYRVA